MILKPKWQGNHLILRYTVPGLFTITEIYQPQTVYNHSLEYAYLLNDGDVIVESSLYWDEKEAEEYAKAGQ